MRARGAWTRPRARAVSVLAALVLAAAEDGAPLQIVAKSHRHGNALIVANDVESIGELRGQKVAVPELASTQTILLYRALDNDTNLGGNYDVTLETAAGTITAAPLTISATVRKSR